MTEAILMNSSNLLLTAISALAAAVGVLWRDTRSDKKATESKLKSCETKHEQTMATVVELTERVGRVEGRQEGTERLAAAVIAELKKTRGTQ